MRRNFLNEEHDMLRRSLLLLAAPALLLFHCGETIENVCDYNNACAGDASADGNLDGSGDTGIDAPFGCDLTKEPKDSLACVADSVGMFVDGTNGNDTTGDGSKVKPMKTIGKALEKVTNKPRIYICEGTYAEDVVLDASHDGVSLYGGWKCADWSYSGGKPVVGKGTLALKVDSVKSGTTIADLDVKSADAAVAGQSSVAAFVNASDKVSFLRDKLEAGAGNGGADGVLVPYTYPTALSLKGNAAIDDNNPGLENATTCPSGAVTTGGKGGKAGFDGEPGKPAAAGGIAGTVSACQTTNAGGGTGSIGVSSPTADGAKSIGDLTASGWSAKGGLDGVPGAPGQGGGGGGGYQGSGGGGGAGGCGGAGGPSGKGGGSSIAIALLSSTASITASELSSAVAGAGGKGATGQAGQTPGGTKGNPSGNACSGGSGGAGGDGGSGGGGAGGISVGVLWKGTAAPTIDASTTAKITVAAKGGNKGLGGATPNNDGIDGVAQAVLQAP